MKTIIAAAAVALAATSVTAQTAPGHQGMNHQGMDHGRMMQATPANPYPPSEMQMHEKMMAAMGADATETWVRKMIEHHRGGIAMSRIVLQQTKDPAVRQMATKTIAEQTKEVADLNGWLKSHGKRPQ